MLEVPMLVLSGVWTTLLIVEFTRGLSPWLQVVNDLVWAAFIAQFLTFRRRGLGYVILLTFIVLTTGAAGMYQFELEARGGPGFEDYGAALWWTAMLLTTMGSEYWPRTPEGRILCLLLAIYAFAVFGYVTAAIAAYFVGKDRDEMRTAA